MRYLKATGTKVIALFVADWGQAMGIILIIGLGYAVSRRWSGPAVGFIMATLLASHLVYSASSDAGRRLLSPRKR